MIPRRDLLAGGVLGGVIGSLTTDAAAAAPPLGADVTDDMVRRIVDAIDRLRSEVTQLRAFPEIGAVRNAQLLHLRGNGRLPAFIEVGTGVWYAIHDWHVRWLQPLAIGRDNIGRYTLTFQQTVLIMRTDTLADFIGIPYDNA